MFHPSLSGEQHLFCYACSIKWKSEENGSLSFLNDKNRSNIGKTVEFFP